MDTKEQKLGIRIPIGSKVSPGDKIANNTNKNLRPGLGCYQRGNHIYATAVGTVQINTNDTTNITSITITLEKGRMYASSQSSLSIGSKVLCKVIRIMNQQAVVDIVASEQIGSLKEQEHHSGLIRKADIRLGATEDVKLHESYRPGDVVLAKILSLGDSRRFFLTTAENELGVIRAVCKESGRVMVPVSWKEMECPETHIRERRKCAKPKDLKD